MNKISVETSDMSYKVIFKEDKALVVNAEGNVKLMVNRTGEIAGLEKVLLKYEIESSLT